MLKVRYAPVAHSGAAVIADSLSRLQRSHILIENVHRNCFCDAPAQQGAHSFKETCHSSWKPQQIFRLNVPQFLVAQYWTESSCKTLFASYMLTSSAFKSQIHKTNQCHPLWAQDQNLRGPDHIHFVYGFRLGWEVRVGVLISSASWIDRWRLGHPCAPLNPT